MRHVRSVRACVAVLVAAMAPAVAADEVDDFINAQLRSQRIPGLALAVIKDREVVKAAGYGVADRTSNAPVTTDTIFKIGSLSKPILATAVMRLVQDGRINLDVPVRTYLQDAPPTWDAITVRRLLSHSAGLVRDADDFDPLKPQPPGSQIRAGAYRQRLQSTPGERVSYSNLGYVVVAEVISAAVGRPWSAYIEEQGHRCD
jgi:CubicO group peptidase (beta-lactamase class C family)